MSRCSNGDMVAIYDKFRNYEESVDRNCSNQQGLTAVFALQREYLVIADRNDNLVKS